MRYTNNAKIIWISKLLTEISDINIKFNSIKIYSNSKQSKLYSNNNIIKEKPKLLIVFIIYSANNNFNSFCTLCFISKQIQVVNWNKLMIKMSEKLKKVHVNFWELYNLPLLLGKIYVAILLDAKIYKIWI